MKYILIIALALIMILGLFTCPKSRAPETEIFGYPVSRVVDGDTFICEVNGENVRVRLIGVDTPESVHPNKDVEYFALEASDYLKELLEGEKVFFEYDAANNATEHKDRYGRLLAYAYRARDSLFVNSEIIRQGYGHAYLNYPFRYMEDFLKYERDARLAERGLWAEIKDTPQTQAEDVMVYFSGNGKKYHRENCRYTTAKSVKIPKSEAIARGMEACKICKP